jgi:hypothetical protein
MQDARLCDGATLTREVIMNSGIPIGQVNGGRRLIAAFNARENLRKVIGVAVEGFNAGNFDPLLGMMSTGASIAAGLANSGFCRLTGHAAELKDEFSFGIKLGAALTRNESATHDRMLEVLTRTLEKMQALNPPKIAYGRAEDATPAPAPLPVTVVAMPARQTTTDIERNEAGEIVGSLQVERDF